MKIELIKDDFLKGLGVGGTLAGRVKALPILDCVRIDTTQRDGSIKFFSTDVENTIENVVDCAIPEDFCIDICLNYKDLYDYIKLIPAESFSLTVKMTMLLFLIIRERLSCLFFRLMIFQKILTKSV